MVLTVFYYISWVSEYLEKIVLAFPAQSSCLWKWASGCGSQCLWELFVDVSKVLTLDNYSRKIKLFYKNSGFENSCESELVRALAPAVSSQYLAI